MRPGTCASRRIHHRAARLLDGPLDARPGVAAAPSLLFGCQSFGEAAVGPAYELLGELAFVALLALRGGRQAPVAREPRDNLPHRQLVA